MSGSRPPPPPVRRRSLFAVSAVSVAAALACRAASAAAPPPGTAAAAAGKSAAPGQSPPPDTTAAATAATAAVPGGGAAPSPTPPPTTYLYIGEYRVVGARQLSPLEIQETVYPFLGPGRTNADVDQARAALEKAYQAKGFLTVSVQVPPQQVRAGVVYLQVIEGKVGRLRVVGARYFSPAQIRRQAPSLAEGTVVNQNAVTRDIVALNQMPDRQVTPTVRAGAEPNTVDVDLVVKDKLPLHGSLEINNRYSTGTSALRLNGSISYNNLFQLGHTAGFSFQLSPENLSDSRVFSGFYSARPPGLEWLSLIVQGTKQDSNVSTLGGIAVAGKGTVIGGRALVTLPAPPVDPSRPARPDAPSFFHSLSLGIDYKNFDQIVSLGTGQTTAPIVYFPFSANYAATWSGRGSETQLDLGLTWAFRGLGSPRRAFDAKRFDANGNFVYVRGDLSRRQELPYGFQVYGKIQGQVADQPLVNSEQIAAGGLDTVRGYLEAEQLGDNGILGSLELRSPSLVALLRGVLPLPGGRPPRPRPPLPRENQLGGQAAVAASGGGGSSGNPDPTDADRLVEDRANDWRVYFFAEGGEVDIYNALPQQKAVFTLASIGFGTRARLFDHLNGSLDAAFPLVTQPNSKSGDVRFTFRVYGDF